jgi:hypothetical protein
MLSSENVLLHRIHRIDGFTAATISSATAYHHDQLHCALQLLFSVHRKLIKTTNYSTNSFLLVNWPSHMQLAF